MRHGYRARAIAIGICLAFGAASVSLAQGRGQGPPPGGGMGGPPFPGGPGGGMPPPPGQRGGPEGRPGLQLGPPGRWWDDKSMAKSLKLRPEQQTKMDAIFEQNRGALVARFQAVQQAEAQMQELTGAAVLDEPALFAQIDRVSQARAELEKANTHMLLQIRKEMDADQIKRLESRR